MKMKATRMVVCCVHIPDHW